jgi:hypothetical protein
MLHFVKRFGPLTINGRKGKEIAERQGSVMGGDTTELFLFSYDGDDVEDVLEEAAWFREMLEVYRAHPEKIGKSLALSAARIELKTSLKIDPFAKIHLHLSPKSLLEGLKLQLIQNLSQSLLQLSKCNFCGDWFEVGAGTGRRLDSKYCRDEHRVLYHSRLRTLPRQE